jgi:hypothetical protein
MDQLLLDELPDDAGHLVAVHLDDRIADLDFRHWGPLRNADDGESRRVTGRPYGAAGPILQGQNMCGECAFARRALRMRRCGAGVVTSARSDEM